MQLQILIVYGCVVLLSISLIDSLPITSKPIDNTPENLAWEAWLMLPPPSQNERARKITPKSIFILNNNNDGTTNHNWNSNLFGSGSGNGNLPTAQAQVQCPPNHRIDHGKCIPTLNIDRDRIMIEEFAQLIGNDNQNSQNYNYEFEEYDYSEYNPDLLTDDVQINNQPNDNRADYSAVEQPLKINLALDKFPTSSAEDNKKISQEVGDSKENFNLLPYRTEQTTTTTTTINDNIYETSTTSPSSSSKTIDVEDKSSTTTTTETNIVGTSTVATATTTIIEEENTEKSSILDNKEITTTENDLATTTILYNENFDDLQASQSNTRDIFKNINETEKNLSTTQNNDDLEIVTETLDMDDFLAENLSEESLNQFVTNDSTILSIDDQTTEDPNETTTNMTEMIDISNTEESSTSEVKPTESPLAKVTDQYSSINYQNNAPTTTTTMTTQTFNNHNKFIYHHTVPPTKPTVPPPTRTQNTQQYTKATQDIEEQLRIINLIVEENKRKSEQMKIRFPQDASHHRLEYRDGLRAEKFRFPGELLSTTTAVNTRNPTLSQSQFVFPTNRFDHEKFLFHRRYFQTTTNAPVTTTTTTTETPNTVKPFWWLPDGWEVDQNGNRPLLIRFWSKFSNNTNNNQQNPINVHGTTTSDIQFRSSGQTTGDLIAPTTTTATGSISGYRENSRSPKEALYREIPAQEVYKVLGAAKHWKHSSKR